MAEFKLGRIKFVYQGAWGTGSSYVVDDVVSVGGKTYICVITHTSSAAFATDLNFNPTKWNVVADGAKWLGTWANNTSYNINDQVLYGGIVYQANTAHISVASSTPVTVTGASGSAGTATITFSTLPVAPFAIGSSITVAGIATSAAGYNATATVTACNTTSVSYSNGTTATYTSGGTIVGTNLTGLEYDSGKWDAFASSFSWQGAWSTNTRYKVRDLVTYGGITYLCNTAHLSANTAALGQEADTAKWDTFNAGITYLGAWSGSTVRYKINDVVKYGADLWICTTYHSSSATFDNTKWSIFVNGFQFESSWIGGTTYQLGDIVTYGGYAYIAKQNHSTSQTPSATSSAYWDVFTTGFTYQGDWSSAGNYYVGSIVRLGGYTYTAIADNTTRTPTINSTILTTNFVNVDSVTGLVDSLPITVASTIGGLSNTSTYYVIGTTVASTIGNFTGGSISNGSSGAGTILSLGAVTSGANPQIGMFVTGIGVTAGTYIVSGSGLTWQVNNSQYTGGTTINIIGTINQFKVSSTPGSATAVTLSATAGQSVIATTNNTPPFATFWTRLNPGIRYNATNGTYTAVSATNVSSAGSSATFNVTRSNSVYTVTINNGGTGYAGSDTLKIAGTSVGGVSPANDIAITVNTVSGGVIQAAGITATGAAVTWTTGTTYVLGDAVYFGASSYICISAHIGTSGNRPDADTTGTYWNLLAAGTNSAVLTTQGDTYYYGALGATRLPIGTDGQILRVSGTAPAWSYFGILNNVVYVAPSGTDNVGLGQGLSMDKPWKTVRYAAKLIEDGYLNPNATSLLARNKQFVIKEVSNYVSYTYQASITGTSGGALLTSNTTGLYVGMPLTFTAQTGSLTITGSAIVYSTIYYVQAILASTSFTVAATYGGTALTAAGSGTATVKYYTALGSEIERDAGYIFEGVVFDLGHGGTSKSVTNARAYINTAGTGYINTATQSQATTFIGADNYLSTLIGNILAQTAPTANYQTLNSVASPAVQIFDSLITAETGTTTTSQALVTIITNALTAGVSSGIPIAQQPQTTISVKTGTYNEVLPIVIPSYCAITGDELRSTVIQPQTAIANLVNDKPKSINSLNRVKALLSNLAANTAISNSTGHAYVLATTAASSTGGFSTLTFATQSSAPFTVGQKITVSGVTPSGFNGSKTVTACTLTSVSFSGSTAGPQTVAGIVSNQDTSLTAGDTGSQTAVNSVVTNVGIMQNIINNGVVQAPVYSFTNPTGYNTAYLIGFGDAKAQIVQNYQFIKDEISAYFNVNFSSIWSALGASGQALFQTDVQNILDSLQYDMTYGGNTQSQITGSTYYSLFQYVGTAQKAATATVYKRLQTVVMQLSTKTAVSASAGNTTSQVTAGTAGSAAAGIFAAQRVGDVVYYINNSASNTTTFSAASTVTNGATTVTFTSITSGTPTLGALLTANNSITGASIFPAGTYLVSQASGVSTVATGNYSSGGAVTAQTFVLASAVNVAAGQLVVGTGVPAGSYVISSYTSGNTITLVDYLGAPAFLTTQAAGTYSFYTANTTGTYNISTTNTATTGTYAVTGASAITPVTSGAMSTSSAVGLAYSAIAARRTEIQNDTVSWVQKFYQTLNFTTATCFRDAGLIVDALAYDVGLGTNFNSIIAGKSYLRAIPSAQYVIANQLAAEIGSINFIGYKVKNIAANGSVITASEIINDAVANITGTATTTLISVANSTNLLTVTSTAGMVVGQPIVFTGITAFSTTTATATTTSTNVVTLSQSVSTLGIANNQQVYFTGAVFGTVLANQIYYVVGATGSTIQLATTLGGSAIALTTASGTMNVVINNSSGGLWNKNIYYVNTIPSGTTLTVTSIYVSGTAFAITNTTASINATATFGAIVQTNGTITYNNTLGTVQGAEILRANKAFLAYEAAAYTNLSYGGGANAVTGTALTGNVITTSANHNFTVGDPVIFTGATTITATITATTISSDGSRPNQLTVSSTTGFVVGMKIVLVGSSISNLSAGTYYVNTVPDSTHITVKATFAGSVFTITSTQSGTMSATVGGIFGNLALSQQYYVLTVTSTTSFTITAVQNSSTPVTLADAVGLATVRYSYDLVKCIRDTNSFIDAIVYDLQYPGNYKARRAVELYLNAVNGSTTSDMFRVRNGTGLRNCTLNGLTGTLTAANQYGTKRPTAGAFVALDPGFGPQDTNVWVATRSHYSQNVTMFGTACSGAKIDAALHAGGNKSMVKNDFTTIISDGIGVWCTGSGSLTELVSVFNYYGYAGYLAELGGRMRATNGNSSYGTYGCIAEGTDTYETPINATLNNRSSQAQITAVVTDTLNKILRYEFGNAGQNYTNTVHTTSGAGYGITVIADEFRDAAVFETRLTDNGDATSSSVGGTSYVSVANTAQTSTIGILNLAATDSALSAAYVGMRVQLTGGTGVGQYANILTYNNGNKQAQVYKDSFATLTVTATTAGGNNLLTVASTATLYVGMPIYLDTTFGNLSANTLYYVIAANFSATQFAVSLLSGGTAAVTTLTSAQTVKLYAAGWDHVVPGTTVSNTPDLTTTYIVEPRISYTAPGYTATARTLSATATWTAAAYGAGNFVAVSTGGTATSYSTTGTSWTAAGAQPSSQTWKDIVYGGGQGATAVAVLGGFGGSGAVLTVNLGTGPTAQQVASVTINNGGVGYTTPPTIVFASASGTGAQAICTVLNGAIATVTINIPGSGYLTVPTVTAASDRVSSFTMTTYGKTYLSTPSVTVSNPAGISATAWGSGGSATQGTYYSYNNAGTTNFYLCAVSGTFTSSGPIHTTGTTTNGTASLTYFGTLATGTAVLTNAGVSSITLVNTGVGYTAVPTVTILDSNSRFVAIANGAAVSSVVTPTTLTTTWSAGAATGKTDLVSIAYGNGVYIAVGGTTNTASAVSATDPTGTGAWIDRSGAITATSTGFYNAITFGNGYFVAINGGGGNKTSTAQANPGVWAAGGNLPASTTWTSVAFGNNRFVALAITGYVAVSVDNATTWTAAPSSVGTTTSILSSSFTWSKISYGQGLFFAIAQGTTVCATSPDGINWTLQAMPSSSNWQGLAFGNPSNKPVWAAVSNTSGTIAASIRTGAQALGRMKVASNVVTEIRMVEPGSNYPKGNVSATTVTTNLITVDDTTNLIDSQPVEFIGVTAGGLALNTVYFVIGATVTSTQFKVSATAGSATPVTLSTQTVTGTYRAGPIATQTDPNKVKTATIRVRGGDGTLANPSIPARGTNNATATAQTQGDGYSDLYQVSSFVAVSNLYTVPTAGANVQFASIGGTSQWYKLVSVTITGGLVGNYQATFQINPALTTALAPAHGDAITTRLKYSQVRLTGHDFLYIGVGNFTATNYPYVDPTQAIQANQTNSSGGGRVFFTSTDQDGNFNVGNLFGVQQATGTATLNANAFNLAGLQSLQLGAVTLGVGSAVITSFSTDPYFTANSDSVVPTQKAIKAYITAQIGGGSSSLNVNTLQAGQVYLANNTISNFYGTQLLVTSKMNFVGGIDGAPVAMAYFLQK
jgi:hypothetical protein